MPRLPSFRTVLDLGAALATIAASVVLVWVALHQPKSGRPPSTRHPPYEVGDALELVPGLDLDAERQTLLIFVRDGCRYCDASMEFYRRLGTSQRKVRLAVVSYDPRETLSEYVSRHRLQVDLVRSVPRGSLKLQGTPTLLLVGVDRRVQAIWSGQLQSADQEKEVLRAIQ